ncbi:MAG: hypothetical protein ABIR46_04395 [Candidatus Saccharimonadales bacterium]
MNDKTQTDVDAINKRLAAASDRARIKRDEEAKRLAEEREECLTELAAQLRDQFYETFDQVDTTDANSVERTMTRFQQCKRVLSGEQQLAPAPVATPVVAPVTTSNVPFDWDEMDNDQKKVIELVAANKRRFFVKPSGSVGDRQGRRLDEAHRAATQPAVAPEAAPNSATSGGNDSEASASESEPTSVPTPAAMPAKKSAAKKTTAVPAVTDPAQSSGDAPADDSNSPKKQPLGARLKAAGKKAINSLDSLD